MTGTKTIKGARSTIWAGLTALEKCCGIRPGTKLCPTCTRTLRAMRWADKFICAETGIMTEEQFDKSLLGIDHAIITANGEKTRVGYFVAPSPDGRHLIAVACLTFLFEDTDCPM